MCISSPKAPVDHSADIARQAETERQGRVTQGASAIDNAFTGFNPDFYNKYQGDYTNYYYPQLDDQYGLARKQLTLNLAKTGNLTSSSGINDLSRLQGTYDTKRTGIANQAINATNDLRTNVDNRKSQLYSDNRSAADPGSATAAAASAAGSLQPGIPSSPLANTFADFFNNVGNNAAVYNTGGRPQQTGVQTYNNNPSGSVKYY